MWIRRRGQPEGLTWGGCGWGVTCWQMRASGLTTWVLPLEAPRILGHFRLTKGSSCACLCPGSGLSRAAGVQEQWTLSPVLMLAYGHSLLLSEPCSLDGSVPVQAAEMLMEPTPMVPSSTVDLRYEGHQRLPQFYWTDFSFANSLSGVRSLASPQRF